MALRRVGGDTDQIRERLRYCGRVVQVDRINRVQQTGAAWDVQQRGTLVDDKADIEAIDARFTDWPLCLRFLLQIPLRTEGLSPQSYDQNDRRTCHSQPQVLM